MTEIETKPLRISVKTRCSECDGLISARVAEVPSNEFNKYLETHPDSAWLEEDPETNGVDGHSNISSICKICK